MNGGGRESPDVRPTEPDQKQRFRFPAFVYRDGQEPDPRFSLANERTFLAWIRTALALAAAAIGLDLALSTRSGGTTHCPSLGAPQGSGCVLRVCLAVVAS